MHILNTLVCSTGSANHYMYYYYVITNKYVGYSLLLEDKLVLLLYYLLSNNTVGWEFLSRVPNMAWTVIPMILSEGDSRVCPQECNESLHT